MFIQHLGEKFPSTQSLLYAFNTVPEDRAAQDLGFDGLNDQEERLYIIMDLQMMIQQGTTTNSLFRQKEES